VPADTGDDPASGLITAEACTLVPVYVTGRVSEAEIQNLAGEI